MGRNSWRHLHLPIGPSDLAQKLEAPTLVPEGGRPCEASMQNARKCLCLFPICSLTPTLSRLLTSKQAMGNQMLPELPDAANYYACLEPIISIKESIFMSNSKRVLFPLRQRQIEHWSLAPAKGSLPWHGFQRHICCLFSFF